jgi:hypothetical protein
MNDSIVTRICNLVSPHTQTKYYMNTRQRASHRHLDLHSCRSYTLSRLHPEHPRVRVGAHKGVPSAMQQELARTAAERRERGGISRRRRVWRIIGEQAGPLALTLGVECEGPCVSAGHQSAGTRLRAAAHDDTVAIRKRCSTRAGPRRRRGSVRVATAAAKELAKEAEPPETAGATRGSERPPHPRARVQGEGVVEHRAILGRPAKDDERVVIGGGGDVQAAATRSRAGRRLPIETRTIRHGQQQDALTAQAARGLDCEWTYAPVP